MLVAAVAEARGVSIRSRELRLGDCASDRGMHWWGPASTSMLAMSAPYVRMAGGPPREPSRPLPKPERRRRHFERARDDASVGHRHPGCHRRPGWPVPATPLAPRVPFSSRPATPYPHKCKELRHSKVSHCYHGVNSADTHRPWGRIAVWLPRAADSLAAELAHSRGIWIRSAVRTYAMHWRASSRSMAATAAPIGWLCDRRKDTATLAIKPGAAALAFSKHTQ